MALNYNTGVYLTLLKRGVWDPGSRIMRIAGLGLEGKGSHLTL